MEIGLRIVIKSRTCLLFSIKTCSLQTLILVIGFKVRLPIHLLTNISTHFQIQMFVMPKQRSLVWHVPLESFWSRWLAYMFLPNILAHHRRFHMQLWHNPSLIGEVNSTDIVLIPKVRNLVNVSQFRPIFYEIPDTKFQVKLQ